MSGLLMDSVTDDESLTLTQVGDRGEMVCVDSGGVATFRACLTALEPFSLGRKPGGRTAATVGAAGTAVAAGGKPMWSRAVLMLVAETVEVSTPKRALETERGKTERGKGGVLVLTFFFGRHVEGSYTSRQRFQGD